MTNPHKQPPTSVAEQTRRTDEALRKLIKVAIELERRVERLERIIKELTDDGK